MTFTFTVSAADWGRIAPELVLAGMALLIMLADLLPSSRPGANGNEPGLGRFLPLAGMALLGLAGAFAATIILFVAGDHLSAFNGMIGSDEGSLYGYIIILSASFLGVLLSPGFLWRMNITHQGEYYALWLLATIGMMLLAAATSFLVVFLGLEMLSLALYILSGYLARRRSSQEAGMKYFLLSSFASAFLLYGIAFTYGATGSTTFAGISTFLTNYFGLNHSLPFGAVLHAPTLLLIGIGLLVVGFAFKVSAIPFQAWTPDVYTGAPAPVTAFMSVGTKAAALIAFARVFAILFQSLLPTWMPIIWAITVLTIVGGSVLALAQTNLKRMLAYSSIAHAGYLLIGVVAGGALGIAAILFYLLCYTFLNLGAFGVSSVLEAANPQANNLDELRGLWYRQPVLAGLLAFFLFSLAGFPPMAGFAAKYYLFLVALQSGHPELLIIGVLASVLGMYYYLKFIAAMFMQREAPAPAAQAALATTTSGPLVTPTGNGKRASRKLTSGALSQASPKGGTAVAVKATTVNEAKTAIATEKEVERWTITWPTWISLGLSALGVLAMGTILPFWLVNVAQHAAAVMSLLR
ncbi:MAG TPA: NADH-quinone oxidoreductase subunit N [Ktedonobacteraceae bacterium]|nr:NADH-quinone oxidoreductase subunit N [Ktedonobacteraceae bacterium]